jgi:cell division control protein 11
MIRRKKNVKKGIQFCLMVCGASGTGMPFSPFVHVYMFQNKHFLTFSRTVGRTTFVNTLCGKTVLGHKESDDPNTAHIEEAVKIKPVTVGM